MLAQRCNAWLARMNDEILRMSYGNTFLLTLFTNNPALAAQADAAGIDRIGIDIETNGKLARQQYSGGWISDHAELDLQQLRPCLSRAALFARCNPLNTESAAEIDRLIALGAEVIMLPYFNDCRAAERFIHLVGGRAKAVLLVETKAAAEQISALCQIDGVTEIHIGLNDLRLSLGWPSHFDVLVSDFLADLCAVVLESGIRLCVGGIARAGDHSLAVPSDLILAQLPRLGASGALVSRAFFPANHQIDLCQEVNLLRSRLDFYAAQTPDQAQAQRQLLIDVLAENQARA